MELINRKHKGIATKVYDFQGVIISTDKAIEYIRQVAPELHHQYFIQGKTDTELKRRVRPQVLEIFERASNEGLYEVNEEDQIPGIKARFEADKAQGYDIAVFTGTPINIVENQLGAIGLEGTVNKIVTLANLVGKSEADGLMKEDPEVYARLIRHFTDTNVNPRTFTDDQLKRLTPVATVNANPSQFGLTRGIPKLYLFDAKGKQKQPADNSYKVIKNLANAN